MYSLGNSDYLLQKHMASNVTDDEPAPNVGFEIFEVILIMLICIIGIIGNTLVILIVYRRSKMRTVTNYFIVNLAIADLFVLIINVPLDFIVKFTGKKWLYGAAMCKLIPPLQTMATTVSVWSLVAISIGRYIAIVYPFRPQLQIRHAKWFIAVAWVIGLIVVIPFMLALELRGEQCSENFEAAGMQATSYTVGVFVAQYIVPLSIIMVCYVRVAKELSRTNKGHENIDLIREQRKETRKVIKILRLVVTAFAILVLPIHLLYVWLDFFKADVLSFDFQIFQVISFIMLYSNSASNPILYNICNEQFREGFLQHFRPCLTTLCPNKKCAEFYAARTRLNSDFPSLSYNDTQRNNNEKKDSLVCEKNGTSMTVVECSEMEKRLSNDSNCSLV